MKKNVLTVALSVLSLSAVSNVASAAEVLNFDFANKYIFKNKTMNSNTKGFTEYFDKNLVAKQCIEGTYNKYLATAAQGQRSSKFAELAPEERSAYNATIESKKRANEQVAGVYLNMQQSHQIEHQANFIVNRDQKFDAELRVTYFNTLKKTYRGVVLNKGSFNIKQSFDEATGLVKIEKILTNKNGKAKTTSINKPLCNKGTGSTGQNANPFNPDSGRQGQNANSFTGTGSVVTGSDSTNIRF